MVIQTAKEKELMVIKMLDGNYKTRQISKACNVSFSFISNIRKKLAGEIPSEPVHTKAYRLFETKRP